MYAFCYLQCVSIFLSKVFPRGVFDIHGRTVLTRSKYRITVLDETFSFGLALQVFSQTVLCYLKKVAFNTLGIVITNNGVINGLAI